MRSVLYNPFEDWKKWSWINWEYKNEKKQPEIPALGGRCEAILSPTPGVKEETYDSSGFYAERIIISPYAISHCREKLAKKKKKKSWKCSRVQLVICLEVLFEVLLRVITASSLQIREFHRYIKRLEEKKKKKAPSSLFPRQQHLGHRLHAPPLPASPWRFQFRPYVPFFADSFDCSHPGP